jgi:uncharacterized protein with von Willebrand factor type A (vWA) domain
MDFCRLLRAQEFSVTTAEVIDALRAVSKVDIGDRQDFRLALRTVVVSQPEELELFDQLFDIYWGQQEVEESEEEGDGGDQVISSQDARQLQTSIDQSEDQEGEGEEEVQTAFYSPVEVLSGQDFSAFREEDMAALARAILIIARKLATKQSRRMRIARKSARVDPRRTVRKNLKYGGTIVELAFRKRKIRKPRLVLICDVSRSMDQYSRFLLQFIHAFQHTLGRVESFVFSTQLTRVTEYFRASDIHDALDRISKDVMDWSGGTRIGQSLRTFNERYSLLLDSRTIVIVLSDGLDTGDADLLEEQMSQLRRRARKIIWLNPLLGSPEYRPLARGMSAAMPYLDVFAPAHNLRSLEDLGRHLTL